MRWWKERKKKKNPLKMEIQVVKNIGDKKRSRNKERKKRKKTIKNGDSSSKEYRGQKT